jgi:hypothetical protein
MNRATHMNRLRNYLEQASFGEPSGATLDVIREALDALDGGHLGVLQGLLAEHAAWHCSSNLTAACLDYARRSLREVRTAELPSCARARVAEWRAARAAGTT